MSRLESLRKVALVGALVAACVIGAIPARGASASVDPSRFNLAASDVTGWAGSVIASRQEDNSRADTASRVAERYFYTGSLAALGRTGGWFESMKLSQGRVKANVTDLVSLFSGESQATAAYRAMVSPLRITTSSLSIGSGAIGFIASRGVGSGPNIVVWFQRGDVYVHAGRMVAEISAWESERTGTGFVNPMPDAAAAVATALAARAGLAPSRKTVARRAHGIQLRLSLPGTEYPLNALVRATLRVKNISHRTLYLSPLDGYPCALGDSGVIVKNVAGQVVSPSGPAEVPPLPCPYPLPQPFKPGATITQRPYIILRGAHVQAEAQVGAQQNPGTEKHVLTPLLNVTLTPADTPTVTLGNDSTGLAGTITGTANGPLLYEGWAMCPQTDGSTSLPFKPWMQIAGNQVTAGCPHPSQWHFVVGSLDHSIAEVDFVTTGPGSPPPAPRLRGPSNPLH